MTERGGHDLTASCACVSEHRPGVLEYEWHHIWPLAMGGEDTKVGVLGRNGIWLCPTAHTNVHEMLRLFIRYGPLTWYEAGIEWDRPINRHCYAVAMRGYELVSSAQGMNMQPG